jgi:hypothetical protein
VRISSGLLKKGEGVAVVRRVGVFGGEDPAGTGQLLDGPSGLVLDEPDDSKVVKTMVRMALDGVPFAVAQEPCPQIGL